MIIDPGQKSRNAKQSMLSAEALTLQNADLIFSLGITREKKIRVVATDQLPIEQIAAALQDTVDQMVGIKFRNDSLYLVHQFHKVFNHPIAEAPEIIPADRMSYRIDFLREELEELEEAHAKGDIRGIADAICDIQYVLDGLVLESGLTGKLIPLLMEVHRSNMSKVCRTEQEAQSTIDHLLGGMYPDQNIYHYKKVGDYFIVYRTADNRVMESINYSQPDFSKIL